jgi:hypothetical protein
MTTPPKARNKSRSTLACLDVPSWRIPTKQELRRHFGLPGALTKGRESRQRPAALVVRNHLSPLDVFCYLKARFGEPNGFQTFLRADDSDNWIHWDFALKTGGEDVWICGTSREIHLALSAQMTDEDWRDLILSVKADYKRVAREKSAVLKSLEQWVIFPNKYVEIAGVCADLHADIVDNSGHFRQYTTPSTIKQIRAQEEVLNRLFKRSRKAYRSCLQLSLLTPVLTEAFVNMTILMLCKKDIRDNKRQFEAFIRSHIDTKLFDLAYKCEGFIKPNDQHAQTFKNFKRVMDKRNSAIHGNCDPEKEQLELVYFEGKRPLFKDPGDHIGKFLEALEGQYQPEAVLKDYEDIHAFLADIVACLEPDLIPAFRAVMETRYPGYDIQRNKMGRVLPDHVSMAHLEGVRYDDELAVVWT